MFYIHIELSIIISLRASGFLSGFIVTEENGSEGENKKQRKRENKHSWLKTYVDPKRAIF